MTTESETKPNTQKERGRLSKDGQWRTFSNVPHLLQYVSNGMYYGRIKVNGKLIRESLKTDVWTKAKQSLVDFLQRHQQARNKVAAPKFEEAVKWFKAELEHDTTIKPQSKDYRLWCLGKLQKTWPALWQLRLDEITTQACRAWASELHNKITCHYYNNTLGTLKQVLAVGIKAHKEKTGNVIENPAAEIKKTRIVQKDLKLPEPALFKTLLGNLTKKSGGWGPRVADLVEFLAYSGMRINSEAVLVTWEDVDWQRKEIIVRGKPDTGTKNSEIRRIPIIPDMETLLTRLKAKAGENPKGPIMQVGKCNEALSRACKEVGISKLTHHDLRHLFATRCIESGVDVPTVSRWLGHKDGGALAMKTYGHLRNEHSQAMAQKVKF